MKRLNVPALLRTDALIGGNWVGGAVEERRFDVISPSSGEVLASVPNLGATETQAAIHAAEQAGVAWRRTPAKQRAAVMQRWFRLLIQHSDDLATILSAEQGKPLFESRAEVHFGASFIEWFAEEARRVYGETVPTTDGDKRYLVLREPIGVCAAITPWNFPVAMITRKVAPAIAAGCTVVVKPAEQTPLSALAVAALAFEAGLPAGVLNVVTGDGPQSRAIGQQLCDSAVVRHLSFTGSTGVGRILMRQCAPTIKKLSLELGGNAPFIVFDDADLDAAVEGALVSKFRNAGQTCVCANRFYVQSGVYDAFLEKFAKRIETIKVGDPFAPETTQGPMIDEPAMQKIEQHVSDALGKGARLLCGGKRINQRYFQPTLLADASHAMLCSREESFGPMAPVFRFETEEEVIRLANDTEFGLASYLYSRDLGRIFRVGEALETGMVGVNTGLISTAEVPFGGIKQSGLGREGSRHGMEDFVELKYLCLGGISA